METIETVIDGACETQRADLKTFAKTGDLDALGRVHTESCPDCAQAAETLIEMHTDAQRPEKPSFPRRVSFAARFVTASALIAVLASVAGGGVLLAMRLLAAGAPTASGLDAFQAKIRYVRMPGRPDICVAAIRGPGAFGPSYYGTARCKDVAERVAFDEEIAWSLRDFAVVRIRGTDTCLATDGGKDAFTLPCSSDD